MAVIERLKRLFSSKNTTAAVVVLGAAGLLLILLSSLFPEKEQPEKQDIYNEASYISAEDYCNETERRLEDFLKNIDGAGDVKVYLSVGSQQRYVYAAEDKKSTSDSKTEEEKKYVIVGSGSDKTALVETVEVPEITGAVVVCSGCGSPAVQERIYKAVAAAIDLSYSKIYVTLMK